MSLDLLEIKTILTEHNLLKEIGTTTDNNGSFKHITYDSRTVEQDSLFVAKGNFKPEYLTEAKEKGATSYVAEKKILQGEGMTPILVKDVQKAMAILGAAFYDYPQNDLFIIGITGTKGKTTTAYVAHHILQEATNNKCALFSTIDRIVGNREEDRFKSNLTTPESLDIFHDMRTAVDNGMTHLVMEVSSQAYKMNRVYGLKYNVGVFLNITPDHIGRNEHPNFADYLYCKEQLLVNSDICVLNGESKHFKDIYYAAKSHVGENGIVTFARKNAKLTEINEPNYIIKNDFENLSASSFDIETSVAPSEQLNIDGRYQINLAGDYNEENATAAIIASTIAGATKKNCQRSLPKVHIPGRMEMILSKKHGTIYVDYAHNYASLHALLRFLRNQTNAGKIIVVVGSTGDKGISRREGFGKALSEEADVAFLTTDDPAYEDPQKIAEQIDSYIDHDRVAVHIELDREVAVREAIKISTPNDVVVLAGRGEDRNMKINGKDIPFPNDLILAKKYVED